MTEGTVITGYPRSGTTLALRVTCNLTEEEMISGSDVNEPRRVTTALESGEGINVADALRISLMNRHAVVKHPCLSLAMAYIPRGVKVIMIFRDLREVIASVYKHYNNRNILGNDNLWQHWLRFNTKMTRFERVLFSWTQAHYCAAAWPGPLQVLSYGIWDKWPVRNDQTQHMYGGTEDTDADVLKDVQRGIIFSSRRCNPSSFRALIDSGKISSTEDQIAKHAVNSVVRSYMERGHCVETTW